MRTFFGSHFHLDLCGALPYFTEMYGYVGPIYMTHPTKAIYPILLVIRIKDSTHQEKIFLCELIGRSQRRFSSLAPFTRGQ